VWRNAEQETRVGVLIAMGFASAMVIALGMILMLLWMVSGT